VTGRWLVPALVPTAWRGTDKGLELGFNYVTALITREAGVWLLVAVLMLDGAARLWREDTRRAQVRG